MFSLSKSNGFPLGGWKILYGSENPIADGIISNCPVTDWTISDVFLTEHMADYQLADFACSLI
jgi:hypothetical protein